MKNIFIVGAGPIGLYFAIRFAQLNKKYGLNLNITLVESRPKGEYIRPGIIASKVMELLREYVPFNESLIRFSDDTNSSIFIQDLERALYKIVELSGIKFLNEKFKSFGHNEIITESEGNTSSYPCDLAIDCTGQKRSLIKKMNEINSNNPPFVISQVADNPIKNLFIANVDIDLENSKLVHEVNTKNPLKFALNLEHLRNHFGWPHFREPQLHLRRYSTSENLMRYYFYYEIPPSLKSASRKEQIEWLKALLNLKTENPNIEFKIAQGELTFTPFDVDPHMVSPAISQTHPKVMSGGDAQLQPDPEMGIGIWSGVSRANAFFDSLKIENKNNILVDESKYESLLLSVLARHIPEIQKEYQIKREALYFAIERAKDLYTQALKLTDNPKEQEIIQLGLNEINSQIAGKLCQDAEIEFLKVTKNGIIQLDRDNTVKEPDSLSNCFEKLLKAFKIFPQSSNVSTQLLDLAKSYKQLANTLITKYKYGEAEIYSKKSIEVYTVLLNNKDSNKDFCNGEIAKLLSNLVIISKKNNKPEAAIKYANQALGVLQNTTMPDKEKLISKIKCNQCSAMLDEISKTAPSLQDSSLVQKKLGDAKSLFNEIKQGFYEQSNIIELTAKFNKVEEAAIQKNVKSSFMK